MIYSPTPASLDHIIQLRAEYGLDTDPDFVRSLYEDPTAYDAERSSILLLGSILLAPDEIEHAYRRAAAEWVGAEVDRIASEKLKDYAGTIINSDASITLLCARCDTARTRDEVESNLDAVEPYALRVKQVAYSVKELQTRASAVSESLHSRGIAHGGAIDLVTNSIKIYLPDSAARLAGTLGEDVKVEFGFVEVEPDIDYDKDDYIIGGLVEGGQYIIKVGAFFAPTSGFAVTKGGVSYILTTGHSSYPYNCADQNTLWNQGGSSLGQMSEFCQYGGDMDGALIKTSIDRTNYGVGVNL